MIIFYTGIPLLLAKSDACLMNLSLLTTDIFVLIFSYIIFHTKLSVFYFLALVLTMSGVVLYNSKATKPIEIPEHSTITTTIVNEPGDQP
eukprot:UN34317